MSIAHSKISQELLREYPTLSARPVNRLLASLPSDVYQRIAPSLKRVPMKVKEMLYVQGMPIEGIYFPGGGSCALVKSTRQGESAEIASVGVEGVIGAGVLFGMHAAPCDVVVHLAGPHADVMPAHLFKKEMDGGGALYDCVVRYSQALMLQIMQCTLCNGLHSAQERCARWLLAAHDHAQKDEFDLTHDLVAAMLGVRRPTVTLVTQSLQSAGFIQHRRGTVRILDRAGLEAAACECYQSVRSAFSRLVPELCPADPARRA